MVILNYDTTWPGEDGEPPEGDEQKKSEVAASPVLRSGGLNQKWPTNGQGGYLTPAVSGSPSASERGTKSEVAHKWARWLLKPCRLGEPHRIRAGGKIRSGYLTPAVSGSPTASERGTKSEVAT